MLKIDTEGYDLEVLKGAKKTISNGNVKYILVESGFDDRFITLDEFCKFLNVLNYDLFGFYDQTAYCWGRNYLWNFNALFIHKSCQ